MPRKANAGDWLALIALSVMWGSAFLLNELALASFPPGVIVGGRIVIAATLLSVVMRAHGLSLPNTLRGWLPIAAMAVSGNVLPFNLIAWAQQYITSSLAGVLMAMMPLFTLTLAHFFIPGGRLTIYRVIGFGTGFIGVAIVIGPGALQGLGDNIALWAALAVLAAALSYAISTIIARRAGPVEPLRLSVGILLVGSLLALPGAMADLPALEPATPGASIALLVLGLVSTGYATILYFRIVQGPGPAFVSIVNYLVPVWAVVVGALFLGEDLAPGVYTGLALILAGIALSEFGPRVAGTLLRFRGRGADAETSVWIRKNP